MNQSPIISADWLSNRTTQAALALLSDAGHQAYVVGGAVRNHLMGHAVGDIDIATDATPQQVIELAQAASVKCVETGVEHGTVTLILSGESYEVTSFRRDVEAHGRRATVAFGTSLTEDAMRRDFTINALYVDAGGAISDPTGQGLDDLRKGLLRFIGSAHHRIREDYLRILRFFRFHAHYAPPDAGFDPDILAACAALADGLDQLSRERIGSEMIKLLCAQNPAPALAAMEQTGILHHCITGANLRALGPVLHFEAERGFAPDPALRLAAIGGEDLQTELRLSKSMAQNVAVLRETATGNMAGAELGYRHGETMAHAALMLRHAVFETPLDLSEWAAATLGAQAEFPIRAADLMPKLQGPDLGKALAELEARWIASGFRLTRRDLLAL
jgi:poly(A) polymerase